MLFFFKIFNIGPVIVPTYPTEMIPQFSNTVMIPQQPIVIDPGMIPAAQGMPQTVYITEPMMGNYTNYMNNL